MCKREIQNNKRKQKCVNVQNSKREIQNNKRKQKCKSRAENILMTQLQQELV